MILKAFDDFSLICLYVSIEARGQNMTRNKKIKKLYFNILNDDTKTIKKISKNIDFDLFRKIACLFLVREFAANVNQDLSVNDVIHRVISQVFKKGFCSYRYSSEYRKKQVSIILTKPEDDYDDNPKIANVQFKEIQDLANELLKIVDFFEDDISIIFKKTEFEHKSRFDLKDYTAEEYMYDSFNEDIKMGLWD